MARIKVKEATGASLDWLVAKCEGYTPEPWHTYVYLGMPNQRIVDRGVTIGERDEFGQTGYEPSIYWAKGGPIIERESISIIRANDDYGIDDKGFTTHKPIPRWFAECSQWTGHSLTASYEGENMDPTFMIGEDGGYYGPTPLIAAMRCYVSSKLGDEVDVPDELLEGV